MDLLMVASNIVVSMVWWTALVFVIVYTLLAPWWATPFGRMIIFLDAALGAALLPSVLAVDFNVNLSGNFWAWFVVVALGTVPITICYRMIYLWRLQDGAYRVRNQAVVRGVRNGFKVVRHALRISGRVIWELVYPPEARAKNNNVVDPLVEISEPPPEDTDPASLD